MIGEALIKCYNILADPKSLTYILLYILELFSSSPEVTFLRIRHLSPGSSGNEMDFVDNVEKMLI